MSISYKKVIMTGLVGGFLGGAVKMGWEALLPPRTPERDEEPPPMTMLHQLDLGDFKKIEPKINKDVFDIILPEKSISNKVPCAPS